MAKVVHSYPPGYQASLLLCVEKTLKSTVHPSPPAASNHHINQELYYLPLVHSMTSAMQEYFENRNSIHTHAHGINPKLKSSINKIVFK